MGAVIPITSARRKLTKEPYNFDPSWERSMVVRACTDRRFFGLVGEELEPGCLASPVCKLALEAAKAIARVDEARRGPEDGRHLLAWLRAQMTDGKVTHASIVEVMEMLDEEEDKGLLSAEALLSTLKPALQQRMVREALETGTAEFQKRGDPVAKMESLLARSRSIGVVSRSRGTRLGDASIAEMTALDDIKVLKTGVSEIDGLVKCYRGTLSVWIGETNAGKSLALAQIAAAAACQGFHVGVATLELTKRVWEGRALACLTGKQINEDILDKGAFHTSGAYEAWDEISSRPGFGEIQVTAFEPNATTVEDIAEWVKQSEEDYGQRMDVVVIDYADYLGTRGDSKQVSTYVTGGSVYSALIAYAKGTGRWLWTATGAKRKAPQRVRPTRDVYLGVDDICDSSKKGYLADLILSLNPRGDEMQRTTGVQVAKNRLGPSGQRIEPLPTDYAVGQVLPPSFDELFT